MEIFVTILKNTYFSWKFQFSCKKKQKNAVVQILTQSYFEDVLATIKSLLYAEKEEKAKFAAIQ